MNNNRTFGLLKSDLEKIVSILKRNKSIDKAILFGSRAKGDYKTGSDIDISIIGENLDLDDILKAKIELDNLSLPYKIDIIIHNRISETELIEHIHRVGITLFERNSPQ
jgi:predicted nucleotidyltransferase